MITFFPSKNFDQYLPVPFNLSDLQYALCSTIFHWFFTENSSRNTPFFESHSVTPSSRALQDFWVVHFSRFLILKISSLMVYFSFTLNFLYELENITVLWASSKYRISKLAQWLGSHFILCSMISLMNSQVEFGKWIQDKKKLLCTTQILLKK